MVVIDAHMHLNGTLADPLKYPALKDQPGAASQSCFAWFGRGDRPDGDASVEALRERMAAYGLSSRPFLPALSAWHPPSLTRTLCLCLGVNTAGVDRAVNVTPGWCGWDNSYTMDILKGNEDWLAAVVLVDPLSQDGPAELERLVRQGASGVRIQPPCTGPLTDPRQTPLWEAATRLGITVQVNLPQEYLCSSQLFSQTLFSLLY